EFRRVLFRSETLVGDPAAKVETGCGNDGRRIHDVLDGPQARLVPFAEGHHHAHAGAAPAERRPHPLAARELQVAGKEIREGMVERKVEHHLRDHPLVKRSHSRRASLRSSQAMRLYWSPGLRSRNRSEEHTSELQ